MDAMTLTSRREQASYAVRTGGRSVGAGVGVGLAIYAGMFAVAGAWRSDELHTAIAAGRTPHVIDGALRSLQAKTDSYHVAAAADARFGSSYSVALDIPGARLVLLDAGLRVQRPDTQRATAGIPYASAVNPGLAAAGANAMGLGSTVSLMTVAVSGNEAY
jgi:hypothetical protein